VFSLVPPALRQSRKMLSFSGARFLVVELTDFGEAEQFDHFGVIVSQSLTFMGQIITVSDRAGRRVSV
jgi:hypothetical protein